MNAADRNKLAQKFITDKLDSVEKLDDQYFVGIKNYLQARQYLHDLIFVKAMGFRGVVATALTGRFLNKDYDPLNAFYDCNPRSIFEQGIFYALRDRIPCGKSDPLNVAKNTNVLDENWAQGKRPPAAAIAAVNFLKLWDSVDDAEKAELEDFFFFELLKYGKSVAAIKVEMPKEDGVSQQAFALLCCRFVIEYPESGTVPQFVLAKLMQRLFESSGHKIMGGDESVFGTNTTSKKPADIWLEVDGKPENLFEITVKKIDGKRLDDCLESLDALGLLDKPVQFICRLPQDVAELDVRDDNTVNFNGKTINFVDIADFVRSVCALLTNAQIAEIMNEFLKFIEKVNRPVATKDGWNKIIDSLGD